MNDGKVELIDQRARVLAQICARILNDCDDAEDSAAAGFRWAYLLLRRPRKYLEQFRHGDLRIDQGHLEEVLWRHGDEIPGPPHLLPEELAILDEHNDEAEAFMRSNSNSLTLVSKSQ